MRYINVEQGHSSFGAYVPGLPGCAAVGEVREATEFHLDGIRKEGLPPVPEPSSGSE